MVFFKKKSWSPLAYHKWRVRDYILFRWTPNKKIGGRNIWNWLRPREAQNALSHRVNPFAPLKELEMFPSNFIYVLPERYPCGCKSRVPLVRSTFFCPKKHKVWAILRNSPFWVLLRFLPETWGFLETRSLATVGDGSRADYRTTGHLALAAVLPRFL